MSDSAPMLPSRLGWRSRSPDSEGSGARRPGSRLRLGEAAVLVAVGLVLAAATVTEIVRQVGIDKRLLIDKRTFRHYVGVPVPKVHVRPGVRSNVDVACAHVSTGPANRLCLILGGPAKGPRRQIRGGYRLPLQGADRYRHRSQCFGLALQRSLCGASTGA